MKELTLIVSSAPELEIDRDIIHNVVRQLNNCLRAQGVIVYSYDRNDYQGGLSESQMYVALFHRKADSNVMSELKAVSDCARRIKTPKVYIYFKDLHEGEVRDKKLEDFRDYICGELEHYVNKYYSEDSIKLQIVLQVLNNGSQLEPIVQDSSIYVGNERIASFDNISFARNNADYQEVKCTYITAQQEAFLAKQAFDDNPHDNYDRRVAADTTLSDARKNLEGLQQKLLSSAKFFAQASASIYSEPIAAAMACFNEGRVEEADRILDPILLKKDIDSKRELYQQGIKDYAYCITECRLKIATTEGNSSLPEKVKFQTINDFFQEAIRIAMEIRLDDINMATLKGDFGIHLAKYHYHKNAISFLLDAAKSLTQAIKKGQVSRQMAAKYIAALGNSFIAINQNKEGIQFLEIAIKALRIDKKTPGVVKDLSLYLSNISTAHMKERDYKSAESEAVESIDLSLSLLKDMEGIPYTWQLFSTSAQACNLGLIRQYLLKYDESEEAFNLSLRLAEMQPKSFSYNFLHQAVMTRVFMGQMYVAKQDYPKAESVLREALSINKHIRKDDDDIWGAMIYDILADVYLNTWDLDAAELSIQEVLYAERNRPDLYAKKLIKLAVIQTRQKKYKDAIGSFSLAEKQLIAEKTSKEVLLDLYKHWSKLYESIDNVQSAANLLHRAQDIAETIWKQNHEYFTEYFELTKHLVALYKHEKQYNEAFQTVQSLVKKLRDLGDMAPPANLYYSKTVSLAADLMVALNKYQEAINYYTTAIHSLGDNLSFEEALVLADLLFCRASLYVAIDDKHAAEADYNNVVTIRRQINGYDSTDNIFQLAKTLSALADIHKKNMQLRLAEKEYIESVKLFRTIIEKSPSPFYCGDYIATLVSVSEMYYSEHYDREALKYLYESIRVIDTAERGVPGPLSNMREQMLAFIKRIESNTES